MQTAKLGLSREDQIVFQAAAEQTEYFFKLVQDLTKDRTESNRMIAEATKTFSSMKDLASFLSRGEGNFQKNILQLDQYSLEVQDMLGKVQLSLAQDSDVIFNNIYKMRLFPLLVGLVLSVIFLLFALWMGIILKNRIEKPIHSLVAATEEIASGNLNARAQLSEANELGVLANAFNIMAAKLEETTVSKNYLNLANQELEAFSYSISHDLRAPLRAIDGFSKALLEDAGDSLNEISKSHISRIIAAVRRMSELIDAVLSLSRISRSEMSIAKVDLSAIAHDIANDLINTEPERKVDFIIKEGMSVEADPTLMRVVLENLIGNSWKYTSKKEHANIEFSSIEKNGKPLFYVRDDGVGFDMKYAKKLFTPFQRLHSESDFPGTGVGLASVKRVMHRHNGRVWAEAVPDEGATFFFTFQSD